MRGDSGAAEPSSFVSPSDGKVRVSLQGQTRRTDTLCRNGTYWGASAGGAATGSRATSSERYTSSFAGNPALFNVTGVDMLSTSGLCKGAGALIDTIGSNVQIAPRLVVGAQL
jgi:hypothetical protein